MYILFLLVFFFFFKQKTAYEMRISDWSSDVCSSDLAASPIAPISDRRGDTRGTAMPDVKRKVEVIRVNPQDWPDGTPAWKAEDPELGHDITPAERYTSEAFLKLAWERIWNIGRVDVLTPVTNAHLLCRLMLETNKTTTK